MLGSVCALWGLFSTDADPETQLVALPGVKVDYRTYQRWAKGRGKGVDMDQRRVRAETGLDEAAKALARGVTRRGALRTAIAIVVGVGAHRSTT